MSKEGESIQPFQGLAEIYTKEPYKSVSSIRAEFIKKIFKDYNFSPANILDLGCGSGMGSRVFSEAGYYVVGIDISRSMLDIGRKAVQNNPNLRLVQSDMRNLGFTDNAFDGAISIFDALNYLKLEELSDFFSGVKRILKDGGDIAFDFLTSRAFDDIDLNPNSVYEGEDFYYMSRARKSSSGVINLELTAFIVQGNDLYRRIRETHTLNLFDTGKVIDRLTDSDFQVERVYDGEEFKEADNSSWHAIILAKNRK